VAPPDLVLVGAIEGRREREEHLVAERGEDRRGAVGVVEGLQQLEIARRSAPPEPEAAGRVVPEPEEQAAPPARRPPRPPDAPPRRSAAVSRRIRRSSAQPRDVAGRAVRRTALPGAPELCQSWRVSPSQAVKKTASPTGVISRGSEPAPEVVAPGTGRVPAAV